MVTGMKCQVCGETLPVGAPLTFTCPAATTSDRHHVMAFVSDISPFRPIEDGNPYIAFRRYLAVDALGAALGLDDQSRERIIRDANSRIAQVYGTGFTFTPMLRSDALSDELGFSNDGGIWIKDETHNVGGSHKARHIFTELLHLLMVEEAGVAPWTRATRPRLAIASCGNAAIAASTLARSVEWPIEVFVPVAASEPVLATLSALGAHVTVCPRRDTDPAGDPCVHRFREAVGNGSIPFGVQGTENFWCLDGGRTIGWEMATSLDRPLDRIVVQVGGGAFASCVGSALRSVGIHPALSLVQAEGCAPLARAWERAQASGGARNAGARWNECMWPWEQEPHSLADGILDDETYDWVGCLDAMADTGGAPIVARESTVVKAFELATSLTNIKVSPTGAAGLAGVLEMRNSLTADERVGIVFSGVSR